MRERYSKRSTVALLISIAALMISLYNFYLIVFKVVNRAAYLY